MLSNFKILSLLCLGLSFLTCSKDEGFTPYESAPKIFINGQIDPLLGVQVMITKAVSTGDSIAFRDLLIKDAKVSLIDAQNKVTTISHTNNGIYFRDSSGLNLNIGSRFKLKVEAKNFETVTSDWVEIPKPLMIDTIFFDFDGGTNFSNTAAGYFEFRDKKQPNDYYLCRILGAGDGFTQKKVSVDISISSLCEVVTLGADASFPSSCFGVNPLLRINLHGDTETWDIFSEKYKKVKEFSFYISKIQPQYYNFLSNLVQPEDWENALIEPRPTFTNIQNGFGIFYASNVAVKKVWL